MNATESTQSRQRQDEGIAEERKLCLLRYGIESLFNTTRPVQNKTEGTKNEIKICNQFANLNNKSGLMCPPYFDGMMCWPPTDANTLSVRECPLYVIGIIKNNNATRLCTETGYWYKHEEYRSYWTNYSLCYTQDLTTIVEDLPNINVTLIPDYLPFIKTMSLTGYAISLCTLLVAFMIMFSIKKLHCPRNKLHMHLFASFILRAGLSLVKDFSFIEGVGLAGDVTNKNGKSYFYVDIESNNWECKFLTSLWEYFITANYSWILMEGLYLHNLIFRALFMDPSNSITYYVTLGWGLPASVILVWVLYRIQADDTLCWTTHTNISFMIIRIPTMISVLINMALFLRIAAVIFSKLQAPIYEVAQRYRKWARSTLVLVPLFGIHYGLFIGMSFYIGISEIVELVWLIGDQIFASFQGFFVAVLYCFLNGEVRAELKPHVHNILVYMATNSCFQICFPCRDRYLRSARGRASVCTTMSCSSLYNNGISHPRHTRSRWDVNHSKLSINHLDRNRDHVCRPNNHVRSLQDMSVRYSVTKKSPSGEITKFPLSNYSSNGNIPIETSLCIENDLKCKSEPHLTEEENTMLSLSHP